MEKSALFYLVPSSPAAHQIYRAERNSRFRTTFQGKECFGIPRNNKSQTPGRLLTIGCIGNSDIFLPQPGAAQYVIGLTFWIEQFS